MVSDAAHRLVFLQQAKARLDAGDDSAFRKLVMQRVVAECMASLPDPYCKMSHSAGRTRKFSNPLFMTPAGLLHAFPELDEHLFVNAEQAFEAIRNPAPDTLSSPAIGREGRHLLGIGDGRLEGGIHPQSSLSHSAPNS